MTPFELVCQHFSYPPHINPHPLQIKAINEQAGLDMSGQYLDTGTGKTFVATWTALYNKLTKGVPTFVIMPPVLVAQWARWLNLIAPKGGTTLQVVPYAGTPAQRRKMQQRLHSADFVLLGPQILLKDYHAISAAVLDRRANVVVDEATMVANVGSQTHEAIRTLSAGLRTELLTGTPADPPISAYGLLKFTNPDAYGNFALFKDAHVTGFDMFGTPEGYKDLDVLANNLAKNSQRVLFSDMYADVDEPVYFPVEYDLDPDHEKLYCRLAEDRLLLLPDQSKIDATTASKLFNALGQIVVNWAHFAQDDKKVSAGIRYLDQLVAELGTEKLLVFANYRMTIAHMVKRYDKLCAGFVNSEASEAEKQRAIAAFTQGDKRLLFVNPRSGGYGLDGLQHVCHNTVFIEPSTVPKDVRQSVARLYRTGQRRKVRVYLPTALGTLQRRQLRQLLNKDDDVGLVIRNMSDLRDVIYGRG